MFAPWQPRSRLGRFIDSLLVSLEAFVAFGLIPGAAVVAAMGRFYVAVLMGLMALGIFLRLKRRATLRKRPPVKPPAD